jgi:hypothetical protein
VNRRPPADVSLPFASYAYAIVSTGVDADVSSSSALYVYVVVPSGDCSVIRLPTPSYE